LPIWWRRAGRFWRGKGRTWLGCVRSIFNPSDSGPKPPGCTPSVGGSASGGIGELSGGMSANFTDSDGGFTVSAYVDTGSYVRMIGSVSVVSISYEKASVRSDLVAAV
jgi:hypothetical protein